MIVYFSFCKYNYIMLRKITNLTFAFTILVSSIAPPAGYAQGVFGLPTAGAKLNLSKTYHPIVMLGMALHPENPFQLDFIIDTGNENPSTEHLQSESQKFVDYFMTTLTVPENETWVNLSPYV